MANLPEDAGRLADDPPRARGRRRSDGPRRRDAGRGVRRPARGDPRPRRRPATIATIAGVRAARPRRRRLPGRRQVADRRGRPRRRAATSSPTATARTRRAGTDRFLLEPDPYAVIEGAAIAAFAIGATEAIIAVRAEDTEAIRRLEAAIGAAEEAGFIGLRRARLGPRPRRSTVRPVQGAYMLGEETVLLKALEGKRGQPEQRPPHPAERGLLGHADRRPQRPDPRGRAAGSSATAPRPSRRSASPDSPGTILVQRPRRRRATASPRSRSARRCATSSRSAARCRPAARSRPSSSAARRAACCRPTRSTRRTTSRPLRAAGAHVGSGLGRRRRRPGLRRRPGPAADPVLRRRGVRQDDPVPDRDAAARRDRATASSSGRPRPTDLDAAGRPVAPTSSASALCDHERLTTLPLPAGCDTSGPSSTSTSCAAPARPASATRSRWRPVRPHKATHG